MKNTLLLFFSFTFLFADAQAPAYQKELGSTIRDMETDQNGNLFVVGSGNIGTGCFNTLSAPSTGGAYLAKINPEGNLVWGLNVGGNASALGVAVDPEGNAVVSGSFEGTGTFAPGRVLRSQGERDIFVYKASAAGEVLWAVSAGRDSEDVGNDVATDALGNIFVTGFFRRTVDFDPSSGVANVSSSNFKETPFVWSLTPNGEYRWARRLAVNLDCFGFRIAVDKKGDIVSTGKYFNDDVTKTSFYLWKLSNDRGNELMKLIFTGSDIAQGQGIATDSKNNIIISGQFGGTMDFDPGIDTVALRAPAWWNADGFVLKLDENGNFKWVIKTGGITGYDSANAVATDTNDNIYICGRFRGIVDFDPGSEAYNLNSNDVDGSDIYTQVLDSTGAFIYAHNYGFENNSHEEGWAVAVASDGRFFSGGQHWARPDYGALQAYGDCAFQSRDTTIYACRYYDFEGNRITADCKIQSIEPDPNGGCDILSKINFHINEKSSVRVLKTDNRTIYSSFNNVTNWLDCDNGFALIPGATDRTFRPEKTGNYAVAVRIRGGDIVCPDTSDCYFIEIPTSNLEEPEQFSKTTVYPNPFSKKLNLENLPAAFAEISIFDLSGKVIFKKEKPAGILKTEISTDNFPEGIYSIFIKNEIEVFRKIILK